MLHVRVGNVDFYGRTDSGFLIGPDGFKGWEGSSATKRDGAERTGAHGAFGSPAFKSARLLTLSGYALADSEAELLHLEEVLSGVGQSRQQITVQTVAGSRWAYGSLEGEIKFDRVGGASEAAYQLMLWMPDPFKYGEAHLFTSTGTDVLAHHRGNTDAWPTITVTGVDPLGYRIAHPGGSYRVTAALAAGQTDVIDMRKGTLAKNGALLDTSMTDADRFSVPGGGQRPFRIESITSGASVTAVLSLTDTFA